MNVIKRITGTLVRADSILESINLHWVSATEIWLIDHDLRKYFMYFSLRWIWRRKYFIGNKKLSEDNNNLLAGYEKHEEYEKYIYRLVYSNWKTWSCIHEKSAIRVAAKIFIKLLKKSVGDASWVFGDTYALKEQLEI